MFILTSSLLSGMRFSLQQCELFSPWNSNIKIYIFLKENLEVPKNSVSHLVTDWLTNLPRIVFFQMLETPWQLCAPSAFAHDSEMDTSSWGFSFQFAFPYTMCIVPAHTTPSFNFYHHDLKQCIMIHLDNHKKECSTVWMIVTMDDWWRQIGNTKVKFIEYFIHWHRFPTTRMRNCTLTAYGLTAWRTQSRHLKKSEPNYKGSLDF